MSTKYKHQRNHAAIYKEKQYSFKKLIKRLKKQSTTYFLQLSKPSQQPCPTEKRPTKASNMLSNPSVIVS